MKTQTVHISFAVVTTHYHTERRLELYFHGVIIKTFLSEHFINYTKEFAWHWTRAWAQL